MIKFSAFLSFEHEIMAENQPVNYSLQSYTVRHKVGKSNDDIYHEGWTHHRNLADESKVTTKVLLLLLLLLLLHIGIERYTSMEFNTTSY